MPESPRRLDLRLTIPASAAYHAVAVDIAEKFAAYAGAERAAAHALARDVGASIGPIGEAAPHASIELEMWADEREFIVTAHSGSTMTRTTCPLPD